MTQFLANGHIPTTNHPRGDALQVGIEAGTGQQVGVASAPNPSRLGTIFSHKPEYSHMPAATQSFLTLKEQCYLLASKQVALLGIQRPGMHNQYASRPTAKTASAKAIACRKPFHQQRRSPSACQPLFTA